MVRPHRTEPVIFESRGETYAVGLSEGALHVVIENAVGGATGTVFIDRDVWPRIVEAVETVFARARVLAEAEAAASGEDED